MKTRATRNEAAFGGNWPFPPTPQSEKKLAARTLSKKQPQPQPQKIKRERSYLEIQMAEPAKKKIKLEKMHGVNSFFSPTSADEDDVPKSRKLTRRTLPTKHSAAATQTLVSAPVSHALEEHPIYKFRHIIEEQVSDDIKIRQKKKAWTDTETEALLSGMQEYGANWKDIKANYSKALRDRSVVQLKDKARNLRRAADREFGGRAPRKMLGILEHVSGKGGDGWYHYQK